MSPQKDAPKTFRRAKTACTECRQQKARCDVTIGVPCTRCRKVDAHCVISEPFRRENKRQKLNQLEHETQELRERLESISGSRTVSGSRQARPEEVDDLERPSSPAVSTPSSVATLPRQIDGLELGAKEIDEAFRLYFSDYSHYLPILDPDKPPNNYYETSIFLFWAIVGTGGRASARCKVILQDLRLSLSDLAFDALKIAPTLESIQGLLLVITWPFPKKTGIWNPTFALLGAVIHCAMNIGLHYPASYQEFAKFRSHLTDNDIRQRTKVWAYCVMMHQRISVCKGGSAFALNDLCQDPKARLIIFERLDSVTTFRLRMKDIGTQAMRAFVECGLQEMSLEQDRTLKLLIQTYQTQVDAFRNQPTSFIDDMDFTTTKLMLQMFHFFRSELVDEVEPITNLFSYACQSIERFDKLSQVPVVGLKALPFIHHFSLLTASLVLLRLYKTPAFSTCVDEVRAKAMVLLGINLAKKMSIQEEDLASRSVKVLGDMLESQKAYRNPNGDSTPVPLRVRSRSAMSIVLDGLVWWREEFGGTMGVYPVPLKAVPENDPSAQTSMPGISTSQDPATSHDPFQFTLDPFFAEQPWIGFEDLLSPSYLNGFLGPGTGSNYIP